jgi:hypothetical protein
MKLLASLAITAALAAFAGKAHADAATVEKFLAWFDGFASTAVADQQNCPKMGTDLNKSIDDNKALLDTIAKAMQNGDEVPDGTQQHMADTGKKVANAVAVKCSKDENVQGAIHRLPGRHLK